jgi:tripartite-type tricarboxylate transporter receptor subunit TctC
MVKTRNLWIAAAATLAAGFLAAPEASAQNNFYQGKTVTIIVGFTPGGGYDQYARTLARHFGRHIPGNPTVIVQNLPSAGSLTAVRTLDTTAPKDGTVITTFNPGLITESVVDPAKFETKFADYAWVGSIAADVRACYAWAATGPKNWDDLMKRKEWILGATGKGSGNYVNGATLRELFGAPVRQILGFPGSAEIRLAIERGELEGDCGSWSSVPDSYLRDKKINVIARFAQKRPDDMPADVPYVGEFAKTQDQKDMLELISGADTVGRPYIMSKQVPADRLQIIRASFDATMKDPQFLADAEKQGLQVSPARGEEVQPLLERMAKAPATTVAKVKKIFE